MQPPTVHLHHSGSFHDLKEILANHIDYDTIPYEVKERAYLLCSKFLGHSWKSVPIDEMCLTRMKGGMSNMLFLCKLPPGHEPTNDEPDKTLLRVYFNPETESHLVAESVIFTLLSERQLGPQLYGIFNGGRLEEFIVSRPLSCQEIRIPEMSQKIARKLAHVHKLNVPISKEPTYLCEALERWMKHLLEVAGCVHPYSVKVPDGRDILITEPILRWEIELIRWIVQLYRRNVKLALPLHLEEEKHGGKVKIVGLEDLYKDLSVIKAFDFANHLCEWAIDYTSPTPPHFTITHSNYPQREQQRIFVRAYLEESYSSGSPGKDAVVITDDDVDKVCEEIEPFVPVSHFFWGVWALLQVELSPVRFGFEDYGKERLSLYFKYKANLTKLLARSASPMPPRKSPIPSAERLDDVNGVV